MNLTPRSEILLRLSHDLFELAHAAFLADLRGPECISLEDEDIRDRRARMRRNAPALVALSDAELDLALDVAQRMAREAVAVDMPAIIRNLQLDAIKIVAWTEAMEGIDDWDSPPAVAIIDYLYALAGISLIV